MVLNNRLRPWLQSITRTPGMNAGAVRVVGEIGGPLRFGRPCFNARPSRWKRGSCSRSPLRPWQQ